jgi:hypothetical protein
MIERLPPGPVVHIILVSSEGRTSDVLQSSCGIFNTARTPPVFAMMASLTVYSLKFREKPLGDTWRAIVRVRHRSWFLLLSVFTLASHLAAVLAFQGGTGQAESGSATVANLVDSIVSLLAGLAVALFVEKGWKAVLTKSGLRSLWPGGSRFTLLALTVVFSVMFIVAKDFGTGLDWRLLAKPAVLLAIVWALLAAFNNQLIRDYAKVGIPLEDFLFWRFCGPTVLIGAIVLARLVMRGGLPELDQDMLTGLIALAVGCFYAAVLQFTILKDRTVLDLNIADLVIPGLTYLLAMILGRTGDRTSWLSLIAITGVLFSRFFSDVLPGRWLGLVGLWRWMRTVPRAMKSEPTVRISAWLLVVNVFGLLMSFAMFGPPALDLVGWLLAMPRDKAPPDAGPQLRDFLQHGSWFVFLILFIIVSQLVAMTFLARKVRVLMRDELVVRFYWDLAAHAHLLKRLFTDTILVSSRLLRPGQGIDMEKDVRQMRQEAILGYRKCLELIDASKAATVGGRSEALDIPPDPFPVRRFLEDQLADLIQVVRLNGARVVFDFAAISEDVTWQVDKDRLFLVWQ